MEPFGRMLLEEERYRECQELLHWCSELCKFWETFLMLMVTISEGFGLQLVGVTLRHLTFARPILSNIEGQSHPL